MKRNSPSSFVSFALPSINSGSGRQVSRSRSRIDTRTSSLEAKRSNSSSRSGSGRQESRSPARRSETNPSTNASNRPENLVFVPATVTVDKSNNIGVDNQPNTTIKRISVKRSVANAKGRSAASPCSESPAKTNVADSQQQQQQPSLSRRSSKKIYQSPCRRNPLAEIDPNKPTSVNRQQIKSKENEDEAMVKESVNLLTNQDSEEQQGTAQYAPPLLIETPGDRHELQRLTQLSSF